MKVVISKRVKMKLTQQNRWFAVEIEGHSKPLIMLNMNSLVINLKYVFELPTSDIKKIFEEFKEKDVVHLELLEKVA